MRPRRGCCGGRIGGRGSIRGRDSESGREEEKGHAHIYKHICACPYFVSAAAYFVSAAAWSGPLWWKIHGTDALTRRARGRCLPLTALFDPYAGGTAGIERNSPDVSG